MKLPSISTAILVSLMCIGCAICVSNVQQTFSDIGIDALIKTPIKPCLLFTIFTLIDCGLFLGWKSRFAGIIIVLSVTNLLLTSFWIHLIWNPLDYVQNQPKNWTANFESFSVQKVQDKLKCCGFYTIYDYPHSTCKQQTTIACSYQIAQQLTIPFRYLKISGFIDILLNILNISASIQILQTSKTKLFHGCKR